MIQAFVVKLVLSNGDLYGRSWERAKVLRNSRRMPLSYLLRLVTLLVILIVILIVMLLVLRSAHSTPLSLAREGTSMAAAGATRELEQRLKSQNLLQLVEKHRLHSSFSSLPLFAAVL